MCFYNMMKDKTIFISLLEEYLDVKPIVSFE